MPSVTLNAYEVTIRKNRSSESEVLSDFNNGKDITDFLFQTFTKWSYEGNNPNIVEDANTSKRLRVNKDHLNAAGRKIEGIVETGEYGYESTVVDGKGYQTKKIEKDESPLLPFYFVGYFPKDKLTGIMVFQRFKNLGVYGVFSKSLKDEFRRVNNGYLMDIKPLVSKQLIEKFFDNGVLQQISFKKTLNNRTIAAPSDKTPILTGDDYYTEYNIVAKRRKKLGLIKRLQAHIAGNDKLDDLVAIENFDYNEVMVTLKLENHNRTISLSGLDNIGAFFDISDEVKIDQGTGLPEFKSVSFASKRVLDDVLTIAKLH